ncbi:MAG: sugar-binding domain-containing protein, partial [Pseudomonadota bacterium]
MSLDGIWRFRLLKRPLDADDDWTVQDTSPDGWRDIQVPGVWTRQNTGNFPHYANVLMPFDCQKPPSIPEENPTGL